MSNVTATAAAVEDQPRDERRPLVREFAAEPTAGDGRTVDVRVVPYGVAADVSDGGPVYREEWVAGCFDEQLRAANRVDVLLNFEHQAGIGGLIGRGTELRSGPDGLHASFRLFATQDGDKALELVREGVLAGVSLEAYAKKSIRTADGVVRRVKAHLDKVALCRRPAFPDAVVLAVREQEIVLDEELLPVPLDPAQVDRMRRLGIRLPERIADQAEALLERAFTMMEWDGSASRWPDAAAYCASCAVDDNPAGQPKTKAMCHLPFREPNGDVNVNALRNALARLEQVQTSQANKDRARRRLDALLAQFNQQQQ